MNKLYPIVLVFLLYSIIAPAQTLQWSNSVGSTNVDYARAVGQGPAKCVYASGVFTGTIDLDPGAGVAIFSPQNNTIDLYVQKLDSNGAFCWAKTISTTNNIDVDGLEVVTNGAVVLTGSFKGTVDFDPGAGLVSRSAVGYSTYILKLDSSGNFAWVKIIGGSQSKDIQWSSHVEADKEGNTYVAGDFGGTADIDPGPDTKTFSDPQNGLAAVAYLLKLDPSGNTVWAHGLPADSSNGIGILKIDLLKRRLYLHGGFNAQMDADPGPGESMLYKEDGSKYIQVFDLDGNFERAFNFAPNDIFSIYGLEVFPNGDLLFCGDFRFTVDFDFGPSVRQYTTKGQTDGYLLQTGPNGEFKWVYVIASSVSEGIYGVKRDRLGNIYISGGFGTNLDFDPRPNKSYIVQAHGNDCFVAKLSQAGSLFWAKQLAASGSGSTVSGGLLIPQPRELLLHGTYYGSVDADPSTTTERRHTSTGNADIFTLKWKESCAAATASQMQVSSCTDYVSPSGRYTYTQSGTYRDTVANTAGCDSVITIELTREPGDETKEVQEACDKYVWRGNTYTASGTYRETLKNQAGCDSVLVLELTIKNTSSLEQVKACDKYLWNGQEYTASGTYKKVIPNAAGCDSIMTLELTIRDSKTIDHYASACESYYWEGSNYTVSGTYSKSFKTAEGCDSIRILHLTIGEASSSSETITACESFYWNGTTYTESGSYEKTFQSSQGCDSIAKLELTISKPYRLEDTVFACNQFDWKGDVYTKSGRYTKTIEGPDVCDSVYVLDLTLGVSNSSVHQKSACESYVWNGKKLTLSGTYQHKTINQSGCDSTILLQLEIGRIDVSVEAKDSVLIAQEEDAFYQWFDCQTGKHIADKGNGQQFKPQVSGNYAVIIKQTFCTDTSACVMFTKLQAPQLGSADLTIFPNPVVSELTVKISERLKNGVLQLFDVAGRLVVEHRDQSGLEFVLDVAHLAAGTYYLEARDERIVARMIVVK